MTQTQGGILDDDGNHNDYFNQLHSPGKEVKNKDATYNLQLRVFYQTDFGESLQVVGSIEELGSWKNYKCPMKWTEGHYWTTENLIITSATFFTYKYVIMKNNKATKWEKGPNRIADLKILPDKQKIVAMKLNRHNSSRSPDNSLHESQSRYSGLQSVNTALKSTA